jgi:hypothetical protein
MGSLCTQTWASQQHAMIGLIGMTTTFPLSPEVLGRAATPAPTGASLAVLLTEVGTATDTLPPEHLDRLAVKLAALASHLVDGARDAGAPATGFTPSGVTPAVLSLRTLGRLAARTAGGDYRLDAVRTRRIRDLLGELV